MSLLGSQVYANSSTPLWLSVSGDVINGDFTVTGTLEVEGNTTLSTLDVVRTFPSLGVISVGTTLNQGLELTSDASGTSGQINTDFDLYFGKKGTSGGNTFLTPGVGVNTDAMTVGGTLTINGTLSIPPGSDIIADEIDVSDLAAGAIFLPTGGTNPTAGTASIPVAADNVVVSTTAVTANSIVLVTRMGAVSAGPGAGSGQGTIVVNSAQIVPNVSFRADLTDGDGVTVAASNVDAEFSWVIIN